MIFKVENTHRLEPINKRNNKVVKQYSGPTIYLGKDNEIKMFTLPTLEF